MQGLAQHRHEQQCATHGEEDGGGDHRLNVADHKHATGQVRAAARTRDHGCDGVRDLRIRLQTLQGKSTHIVDGAVTGHVVASVAGHNPRQTKVLTVKVDRLEHSLDEYHDQQSEPRLSAHALARRGATGTQHFRKKQPRGTRHDEWQ